MATPELQLHTLWIRDGRGRMTSTREPGTRKPPRFTLIRSATSCAWAVRSDVDDRIATELDGLARDEPPTPDLETTPIHRDRYVSLVGGRIESGVALSFPDTLPPPSDAVVLIDDLATLSRRLDGWNADEIPGRSPIFAVLGEDGYAVSACCCARTGDDAAEAGLATAEAFRGRGFGPLVTAAWARAIRDSGRIPLYSTEWTNTASRAVGRKLGLVAYASDWNLAD